MQPGIRRHENAREDACGERVPNLAGRYAGDSCDIVHVLAVLTYLQGTVAAGKS